MEVENTRRATSSDVRNEVGANTITSLARRALLPRVRRVDNILWWQVWVRERGNRETPRFD